MSLEQILLVPITLLCIWSLFDSIAIVKLIQMLFMMREGDKLACSIYCNIITEILNVNGVKEILDECDANQKIGKFTEQINQIVLTNMKIEKGLYAELKRRHITDKQEKQLEEIRNRK